MKKLLFTSFLISLSAIQARVLTVSNNEGAVAMFKDVQPAIDSAEVGDTVFVHYTGDAYPISGSPTTIYIRKRIVLMGEGYKGIDNNPFGSYFQYIDIDSLPVPNGTGLKVSGVVLDGIFANRVNVTGTYGDKISGIIIKNSKFVAISTIRGKGHIIINSLMEGLDLSNGGSHIISNNIFRVRVSYATNCIISNNIFIESNSTYGSIENGTNLTVANNIFISTTAAAAGGANNSFSNNVHTGTGLPSGNVVSAVLGTIFVATDITGTMSEVASTQANWVLKAGSPAIGFGTDGKDAGVYGGQYPWPTTRLFRGSPGLPKVTSFEVQNAVIAPNGTLKFNFKAKSFSVLK